jgi:O-acetyl-ADP-ribose deacetylase (regulator of RNase III)
LIRKQVGRSAIELVEGDITTQTVDAIVNAANSRLVGGGGVDGAIHRAGGPSIMEECRRIGGCPTGQAVITTGGDLPAHHVIHGVGPVYADGNRGEPEALKSAYQSSLRVGSENGCRSVAFPSISTGAYRYPIREAAGIALEACLEYVRSHPEIELVRFVLFSHADYEVYRETLDTLSKE